MRLYPIYKILIFTFLVSLVSACASTSDRDPSSDSGEYSSNAHPSAYGMDGFFLKKQSPEHETSGQALDFFYKHCNGSSNRAWYSKTAYECEGR